MPRIPSTSRHLPAAAMRIAAFPLSLCLCLAAPAWAQSGGAPKKAHQHGIASMGVAVERNRVVVTIDSPLDNLLGFERAPRTDEEKQRAAALVAALKAGETLLRIDPAAGCKLQTVEIDAPVIGQGRPEATAASSGHADLEADYEFACDDGSKAGFIEITLFDAFKRLQRLQVQVAGTKGQTQAVLKRPASRIAIAR
jgi:hypothetical protein